MKPTKPNEQNGEWVSRAITPEDVRSKMRWQRKMVEKMVRHSLIESGLSARELKLHRFTVNARRAYVPERSEKGWLRVPYGWRLTVNEQGGLAVMLHVPGTQATPLSETVIGLCKDCGKACLLRDDYIVRGEVWREAGMAEWDAGHLHAECLEARLGLVGLFLGYQMDRNAPITYRIGQPADTSQCLRAKDGEIFQVMVRPNTTPDLGSTLKPGV